MKLKRNIGNGEESLLWLDPWCYRGFSNDTYLVFSNICEEKNILIKDLILNEREVRQRRFNWSRDLSQEEIV